MRKSILLTLATLLWSVYLLICIYAPLAVLLAVLWPQFIIVARLSAKAQQKAGSDLARVATHSEVLSIGHTEWNEPGKIVFFLYVVSQYSLLTVAGFVCYRLAMGQLY